MNRYNVFIQLFVYNSWQYFYVIIQNAVCLLTVLIYVLLLVIIYYESVNYYLCYYYVKQILFFKQIKGINYVKNIQDFINFIHRFVMLNFYLVKTYVK